MLHLRVARCDLRRVPRLPVNDLIVVGCKCCPSGCLTQVTASDSCLGQTPPLGVGGDGLVAWPARPSGIESLLHHARCSIASNVEPQSVQGQDGLRSPRRRDPSAHGLKRWYFRTTGVPNHSIFRECPTDAAKPVRRRGKCGVALTECPWMRRHRYDVLEDTRPVQLGWLLETLSPSMG